MSKINNFIVSKIASLEARRDRSEEEGQGLAEYGLILALVAVLCVLALTALKDGINTTLGSVTSSL